MDIVQKFSELTKLAKNVTKMRNYKSHAPKCSCFVDHLLEIQCLILQPFLMQLVFQYIYICVSLGMDLLLLLLVKILISCK